MITVKRVARRIIILKKRAMESVFKNPAKASGGATAEAVQEKMHVPFRQDSENTAPRVPRQAIQFKIPLEDPLARNKSTIKTRMAVPTNQSSGKKAEIWIT
jgi:hypothetical protein